MDNTPNLDGTSEQPPNTTSLNDSSSAPTHLQNPYQTTENSPPPIPNGVPAEHTSSDSISATSLSVIPQSNGIPLYPPQQQGLIYNSTPHVSSQSQYAQAPQQAPSIAPRPSLGTLAPMASPSTPTPTPSGPTGGITATRGATPVTAQSANVAQAAPIIPPSGIDGSPTRVYINQKVTPALLEGMKHLATKQPENPLKWLGEYLLRRSEELEAGGTSEAT